MLEPLSLYLNCTFATCNDKVYLQKQGSCIRDLSHSYFIKMVTARWDTTLVARLQSSGMVNMFKNIEEVLVFPDCWDDRYDMCVCEILLLFKQHFASLDITHEVVENRSLRFLDLSLTLHASNVCWQLSRVESNRFSLIVPPIRSW